MRNILSELESLKGRILHGDFTSHDKVNRILPKLIDDINRIMSQIRMIEK